MSIATIVTELNNAGQNFEWYPTTREIIEAMYWDIKSHKRNHWFKEYPCAKDKHQDKYEYQSISLLDIGAGNCKVYNTLKEISNENHLEFYPDGSARRDNTTSVNQLSISKYMCIEKSQILIETMPAEALIVGTDFWENTLIDKKTDVVFCNPPFKEYERWAERIIKESNAQYIYFVIPQRWGNVKGIANALKLRKAKVEVVGNFDFLNSEDRKARAKVSLVKIYLRNKKENSYGRDETEQLVDPFNLWFDEEFKLNAKQEEDTYTMKHAKNESKKETIKNALVAGGDLVSTLVSLYDKEMETLIFNYKKVAELDSEILKELNVNVNSVLFAFKEKIGNLKTLYWEEVFSNLGEITKRLTSATRKSVLSTLAANTNIDFTSGNIRSIVIWVIKNANKYFDSQMISVYDTFTSDKGIALYKSNKHWQKDTWRYNKYKDGEKGIKYALDYRIILHRYRDYMDRDNRLPRAQLEWIQDIIIVARNLGYSISSKEIDYDMRLGEKGDVYFTAPRSRKLEKGQKTNLGKIEDVAYIEESAEYQYLVGGYWTHYSNVLIEDDIFTTVKGHKNGNIHFQFNQQFIKKLNLEVGRLRGWIKSPQEAAEEFDISMEEATKFWKSNFTLLPSHLPALLPNNKPAKEEEKEESVLKKEQNLFDFSAA